MDPLDGDRVEVRVVLVVEAELQGRAQRGLRHELGKLAVGIGSEKEVDGGQAIEQVLPEMLGHATGDPEDEIGAHPLELTELTDARGDPLLGPLPNGAGVEEDERGFVDVLGERESRLGEEVGHERGVRDVHLATVGLDVCTLHPHTSSRPPRRPAPAATAGDRPPSSRPAVATTPLDPAVGQGPGHEHRAWHPTRRLHPVPGEANAQVVAREPLPSPLDRRLGDHGLPGSHRSFGVGRAEFAVELPQRLAAPLAFRGFEGRPQAGRGGVRTRRVAKHVEIGEGKGREQFVGPRELRVRLPGETDHDIRADGRVGEAREGRLHHLGVASPIVASVHASKDPIIPALQGKVQVSTEPGIGGEEVEPGCGDVLGFEGVQAKAGEAGHGDEAAEEVREVRGGFEVPTPERRVDPGESDLRVAGPDERARLLQTVAEGSTPAAAPHLGDHTKRAVLVATVLDLERGSGSSAIRGHPELGESRQRRVRTDEHLGAGSEPLGPGFARGAGIPLRPRVLLDPVGEPGLLSVAHDPVDSLDARQRQGVALGQAAGGDHPAAGLLAAHGAAHGLPAVGVRGPGDGTGVDEHPVRRLTEWNDAVTGLHEPAHQALHLLLVGLAAERLEGHRAPPGPGPTRGRDPGRVDRSGPNRSRADGPGVDQGRVDQAGADEGRFPVGRADGWHRALWPDRIVDHRSSSSLQG